MLAKSGNRFLSRLKLAQVDLAIVGSLKLEAVVMRPGVGLSHIKGAVKGQGHRWGIEDQGLVVAQLSPIPRGAVAIVANEE